jgi:putative membrane protein
VEIVNIAQIIPLADTWMHGGWGWGWMTLMMVVMVLFWGAVIFGIVWLIRGAADGGPGQRRESPTEVLERRFAEGAISVEDYHARREALLSGTAGSNGARNKDEPVTPAQAAEGRQG